MRALVCNELGPADKLRIEDVPDPRLGHGDVMVRVLAAGINFPDLLVIQGLYQEKIEPPFIPGNEASGVITAVGRNVNKFKAGDRVIIMPQGAAFAELCSVPAERVIPIPSSLNFEQAAGFAVAYGTSYHALKQASSLQEGETVLVLGAAGGVGITAVECAKAMGARVIAAASSEKKLAFARLAGADETINYSEESLRDRCKALTYGKGVDIVYDPVGGELAQQALRSLAWHGRYLVIGFASGDIPKFPANIALLKEASIIGVWWGTWLKNHPDESKQNMTELFELVSKGTLKPRVTESWPLENYLEAFSSLANRTARGKVILRLREDWS
jgi:NADPH2:quinone reductase